MHEIKFYGRGGQGAVTAAELLAVSAALEDNYVKAFPFFGVERRGAPVRSFCRVSKEPIRINQYIYAPTIAVVLDSSLMENTDICLDLQEGGMALLNSKKYDEAMCTGKKVCAVDATEIAIKHLGKPTVNTAMLGALVKVTGIVKLESLKTAIKGRFSESTAEKNIKIIEECYDAVACRR